MVSKNLITICAIVASTFVVVLHGAKSEWKKASLTNYNSYPACCDDPTADQTECTDYSGCKYRGDFAYVGHKSEDWVKKNNIIAINKKDEKKYKLKTLEIRRPGSTKTIKATVYDNCSDGDCNGCCTKNSKKTGFLIDMEANTLKRFGGGDGTVEFRCVDC